MCRSCCCRCAEFKLSLRTDNYPEDSYWKLEGPSGVIDSTNAEDYGIPESSNNDKTFFQDESDECLAEGEYKLTLYDAYGDGFLDYPPSDDLPGWFEYSLNGASTQLFSDNASNQEWDSIELLFTVSADGEATQNELVVTKLPDN